MNALVTGGAGLVGSSLIGRLLGQGATVFCVDDLSLGTLKHLREFEGKKDFTFEKWDVSAAGWHKPLAGKKIDIVFHMAANSDVSMGSRDPRTDMQKTFSTTFETLTAAKELGAKNFVFASTSAVYGKNPPLPTPEGAGNMHPVSIYGAGKLASEAFVSAFVENFALNAWVYRFGNVVGRRLTHGVIHDFTQRLRKNPQELVVLGNGAQNKTYIDVEDCVLGMLHGLEKSSAGTAHAEKLQIFNLSTDGSTSVRQIAEETVRVLTAGKARIQYGSDSVGWVGDVAKTSFDVTSIGKLGWKPKLSSNEAVFKAIRDYAEWSL